MPSPLSRQKISTHTHKGTGALKIISEAAQKYRNPLEIHDTTRYNESKEMIFKGNRRTELPVLADLTAAGAGNTCRDCF
jgi:hypothetical protein